MAELQARVQLYEQGEIERNIALQNVAKRLKEDNEKLRSENNSLKERVSTLERQHDQQTYSKKRWGESLPEHLPEKKIKLSSADPFSPAQIHIFDTSTNSPSPPSMASSPDSSCDSRFSFDPSPEPTGNPTMTMLVDIPSAAPPAKDTNGMMHRYRSPFEVTDTPAIYGSTFDCGFCNEDTPCVCREIAIQQQQAALGSGIKNEDLPAATHVEQHVPATIVLPAPEQQPTLPPRKKPQKSILDNLPPYQPAIPLRRGSGRKSSAKSIFKVSPVAQGPSCSGDPSDCPACSDDTFGRAFCSAIGDSVATLSPCEDCPSAYSRSTTSDNRIALPLSPTDPPLPTFPSQLETYSSTSG